MSEVKQLEQQLVNNQKLKDKRDAIERLYLNPDFRSVILDGFCLKDCANYVQLSVDLALSPESRADALAKAQAAGHLQRYLHVELIKGSKAAQDEESLKAAIVEARAEEMLGDSE